MGRAARQIDINDQILLESAIQSTGLGIRIKIMYLLSREIWEKKEEKKLIFNNAHAASMPNWVMP